MAEGRSSALGSGFGSTLRRDAWWVESIPVIVLLGGFGLYATFRAFEGKFYEWGPYLSPFYSPLIDGNHHWLPKWFSPALLILAIPLAFRVTCYYYRKAYYRAFFLDPPACAVGEPAHRKYSGETRFPLVLQNIHRYGLFFSLILLLFLWKDAITSFWFEGHFFIGLGSLVLTLNVVLLSLYALSCHSWRHLIGGRLDCFTCSAFNRARYGMWKKSSFLNERHMLFAWASLLSVGFADFYVRLVASGAIHDLRIL